MNDLGRILVTGAKGQIGTEITRELRRRYGGDMVIASDIKEEKGFVSLDVTNYSKVEEVASYYSIDTFFHLAAILSATGEKDPVLAWNINTNGLRNVLEVASKRGSMVFWPSSIAVFGPDSPKVNTPQDVFLKPTTMYGVTKVAGELLCNYYYTKNSLDVRCVRLPGIISSQTLPTSGTTDYAVEMFYGALSSKHYDCFVREDTTLPMMYMPDCNRAITMLMEGDTSLIKCRTGYNIASMSFSAGELASEIRKHIPDFTCDYKPDYRENIAESWPHSIDDSLARNDWNWKPSFDLSTMVKEMLYILKGKLSS